MTNNHLQNLYISLQEQLETNLRTDQNALSHPTAKGDSTEANWISALKAHLPQRYQVSKGFVIDAKGRKSDQIDLVVYDWQYTPLLYNKNEQRFIPAESVYAVFEVKQTLNRENILYAGKKIASVRKLHRTSAEIPHAGGKYEPKPLFSIIGGILTYRCDWKPPFGKTLQNILKKLDKLSFVDIGCVANKGTFETSYNSAKLEFSGKLSEVALAAFIFRLLAKFQSLGTVSAIDYKEYNRWLD